MHGRRLRTVLCDCHFPWGFVLVGSRQGWGAGEQRVPRKLTLGQVKHDQDIALLCGVNMRFCPLEWEGVWLHGSGPSPAGICQLKRA